LAEGLDGMKILDSTRLLDLVSLAALINSGEYIAALIILLGEKFWSFLDECRNAPWSVDYDVKLARPTTNFTSKNKNQDHGLRKSQT
jgi:hypothetical protein